MLVLARRRGEKIMIDDGRIVITLVEVWGDKAKLGIEAPRDIDVHREEIYRRLKGEDPPPAEGEGDDEGD